MLSHRQAVMLCGLLGLVLAACGSTAKTGTGTSPAATASQCTPGTGLTKTATTASYTMVLDANASEAMYTQAQVAAQHPKTGEVMLHGQMNAMAGSGAGDSSTTMMGTATTMAATPTTTSPMGHSPMSTTSMGHSPMTTTSAPMGTTPNTQGMGGAAVRHLEVHICSRVTGKVVQNAQPTITVVDDTVGGMADHVSVAEMEGIGAGVADLHYGNNITMPAMHRYTVTVSLNGEMAVFNVTRPS